MKKALPRVAIGLGAAAALYLALIINDNLFGPSTRLFKLRVATATPGPDGRPTIYLGESFRAEYTVIRHRRNGDCTIDLHRYLIDVSGPTPGRRRLISHVTLTFVGKDEVLDVQFPQGKPLLLTHEVDEDNRPILTKPLLEDGIDEKTVELVITGRYHCNIVDLFWPRWLQGGHLNETERVRVVLRRSRP